MVFGLTPPYGDPQRPWYSAEVVCVGGAEVNKAQLIDALAERLGDKKVAAAAVAGLGDVVVRTVNDGDKVTITGFGVFEKRARAARTARNPRTGEAVTEGGQEVRDEEVEKHIARAPSDLAARAQSAARP